MSDTITEFCKCQKESFHLFREKYLSRGGTNITAQGFHGVFDRIRYDKLMRLVKVAEQSTRLKLETESGRVDAEDLLAMMKDGNVSIDDAKDDLYDIANYALICVMLLEDTWG